MVATLLALWRQEDARAAVVDFLPTRTIATLPLVAKPMRDAKSCLLLTAIKRRGKTVPNPPTTRACLDTLLVGEPQHFCEKWERGLEEWIWTGHNSVSNAGVQPFHGVGSCLELTEPSGGITGHRGFARRLRAQNLLVTRYRVAMSYVECSEEWTPGGVSVGYALLCGPSAPTRPEVSYASATSDFIAGPRFRLSEHGIMSLIWFYRTETYRSETLTLVEDVDINTPYIVDATFNHESVNSCFGTTDVSVIFNGNVWTAGGLPVMFNPLSSIHLYNYSRGRARIGEIEIWSERAAPNQVWKNGPNYARAAVQDDHQDDSEDDY